MFGYAAPKDPSPPNFMKKAFVNNHKTAKFTKVFALESFPLCMHAPTYGTYSTMLTQLLRWKTSVPSLDLRKEEKRRKRGGNEEER